jgi:hypothetical protein
VSRDRPLSLLWAWLGWCNVRHFAVQWINRIATPIAALLVGSSVYFLPEKLNLFGQNGLVGQMNGLIQILTGFFIASLAAVATFQRHELDEVMGGDPPTLPRGNGHSIEDLTRRRFLCLLFGYLSGASIVLYLAGVVATVGAPLLVNWSATHHNYHIVLRALVLAAYGAVLMQILITAFLGLYFLIDRIHQPSHKAGFVDDDAREADRSKQQQ